MRLLPSLGLLVALPGFAVAQVAPPPALTPGRVQQLAPTEAPRLAPSLRPAVPDATRGANDQMRVRVTTVRLTGNAALSDADLLPILRPLAGQEVPLAAIEDARIQLISAYGRAGYPFVTASAGLSPEAGGAALTMSVVEGHVASVKLDGDIGPAGTQVLRFLEPLVGTGAITARRLERALLLAGDIPGVTVRSVVRPLQGGEAGALELVAQLTRRPFTGYLSVDNRGYRLTGPVQALLGVSANSFTSLGERLEATIFQTEDWEQSFGQLTAETFVGASGLRVRAYAGGGRSRPGGTLSHIGYEGNTTVAGIAAQYPIIRSRPMNLFTSAQFDYFDSDVDVGGSRQSLDEVRALRFGFEGNALDSLLSFAPSAADTAGNIRLHRGVSWLGATAAGAVPGPGRIDSNFEFTKWSGEIGRTQPLWIPADGMMVSLYGLVAGQISNDVLPISEKFILGGSRLGRGFYAGQVTGDSAIGTTIELQLNVRPVPFLMPGLSGAGEPVEVQPSAQFYAFYDYGRTRENLANDPDRRIESYGGGVRIFLTNSTQLDIEAAHRLTRRVDAAGDAVPPLSETAGFFRVLTRF